MSENESPIAWLTLGYKKNRPNRIYGRFKVEHITVTIKLHDGLTVEAIFEIPRLSVWIEL